MVTERGRVIGRRRWSQVTVLNWVVRETFESKQTWTRGAGKAFQSGQELGTETPTSSPCGVESFQVCVSCAWRMAGTLGNEELAILYRRVSATLLRALRMLTSQSP